jgi:hypothetical protein
MDTAVILSGIPPDEKEQTTCIPDHESDSQDWKSNFGMVKGGKITDPLSDIFWIATIIIFLAERLAPALIIGLIHRNKEKGAVSKDRYSPFLFGYLMERFFVSDSQAHHFTFNTAPFSFTVLPAAWGYHHFWYLSLAFPL